MDLQLLTENLNTHFKKELPFVVFSLPDSDSLVALLQNDSQLHTTDTFIERSVVMAPFNFTESAYCIPYALSTILEAKIEKTTPVRKEIIPQEDNTEKDRYTKLVQEAIHVITIKNANKIVLSRKYHMKLKKFQISTLCNRIFNLYPGAFRYIWFHPDTGLWCGATPEILVKTENTSFTSMALAGTQPYNEKAPIYWNDKEIEEQRFVTDAITNSLQKVTDVLKISKTYTHKAGTLAHLRTDITGILRNGKATLKTITTVLHPTPAVCGTPKKEAKKFITEKEGYDREFYTGFVGPICGNDRCSNLYVNLRCMKITGNTAILYTGGGITGASKPFEEWQETQNKLQTMLQVLQPML
ncbi:isochorismate synthase [Ulvibacter sp. MAR_2010_11]|uniref:isochorismate synthase n=1 Tax=Ulvibacter sp. MAR_2010_11 TaxID=1250229 RepID=UPI000C2C3F30|nr:isochorismate synthase [Ulvibacter sp. MAR_2010_11]PKA84398.1 isochorismate synthase [Ulvibacter sp. MAR_2010_11]